MNRSTARLHVLEVPRAAAPGDSPRGTRGVVVSLETLLGCTLAVLAGGFVFGMLLGIVLSRYGC